MSGDLRFDDRVAVVTGAGANPGLGRSYAVLLASRGARVVVNDIGMKADGGLEPTRAQAVADEITASGGDAIADTHSIAEESGAQAVVDAALDRWGRVDVVVNNAGYTRHSHIDEISADDILRTIGVHLLGSVWMCRAAWPHMREAGYGRIVNIASMALLGHPSGALYSAAKGGNLALTRALAAEGAPLGIKVNALVPRAATESVIAKSVEWRSTELAGWSPDQAAQTAAVLAHESCPVSGKCIGSAGNHVWEIYYAQTHGYDSAELTAEDVRANLARVTDRSRTDDVPDPADLPPAPVELAPYGG
jgi:NAD(P)-dependent dehydrogenase (short-subunit alcohol dehydrogenase family)